MAALQAAPITTTQSLAGWPPPPRFASQRPFITNGGKPQNPQPKPLEPNVQELLSFVPTAHQEAQNVTEHRDALRKSGSRKPTNTVDNISNAAGPSTTPASPPITDVELERARAALLQTLSMFDTGFNLLSEARVDWWNSPAKKLQRREWSEACNTARLTDLQKVNQKCIDMISDMAAVVGRFRRWNLDVTGPSNRHVDEETGVGSAGKAALMAPTTTA